MYEQQLDLFFSAGAEAECSLPLSRELRPAATVLDDQALIAAIPDSNLADSIALADEAGRFSNPNRAYRGLQCTILSIVYRHGSLACG
jgi:hypothetical protein